MSEHISVEQVYFIETFCEYDGPDEPDYILERSGYERVNGVLGSWMRHSSPWEPERWAYLLQEVLRLVTRDKKIVRISQAKIITECYIDPTQFLQAPSR